MLPDLIFFEFQLTQEGSALEYRMRQAALSREEAERFAWARHEFAGRSRKGWTLRLAAIRTRRGRFERAIGRDTRDG